MNEIKPLIVDGVELKLIGRIERQRQILEWEEEYRRIQRENKRCALIILIILLILFMVLYNLK